MNQELFDDLIASCHEAIAHERGELKLKSTIITIPDDDISAKFNLLPQKEQQAVRIIIDSMLNASNQ